MDMKYNEKYDLYIDDDFVIYYLNKKKGKLMQRTIYKANNGYLRVSTKNGFNMVHRVIWEVFNGEIPDGYEIDHINAIRDDNRLENLRCVTHAENNRNPLTRNSRSKSMKGNTNGKGNRGKLYCEFGRKFFEHYEITYYQNPKLYHKEHEWFRKHNKCSWE